MSGPIRTKVQLLRESNKGLKSRLKDGVRGPALERDDVRTSTTEKKIERGDKLQALRLRNYPSIDVDFDRLYAGSIEGGKKEAEEILMRAGFRNGPLAYVEVTNEFGPDDGSYWLQIITETGKFPFIDNRVPLFRRVKDQIHVVIWEDEEESMTHFGAHREKSAMLQPARHASISESDAQRGIRDFRNKLNDEFGKDLPEPLS